MSMVSFYPLVPAKAGTQGQIRCARICGFWIPASAGMSGDCGKP
jgi:hypothetical protein